MSLKIKLTSEISGDIVTLPIEIQAHQSDIKINEIKNFVTGEVMKIGLDENGILIDTDMETNQVGSKLIFLFFTYKGRLFVTILNTVAKGVYTLHILTKILEELSDILGEYEGSHMLLDIRKISGKLGIDTQTLDMILDGKDLPGVQPSKCVIRV